MSAVGVKYISPFPLGASALQEYEAVPVEISASLERSLQAAERRALECVAINERQAIRFSECQARVRELEKVLGQIRVLINDKNGVKYATATDLIDAALADPASRLTPHASRVERNAP